MELPWKMEKMAGNRIKQNAITDPIKISISMNFLIRAIFSIRSVIIASMKKKKIRLLNNIYYKLYYMSSFKNYHGLDRS